MTWHHDLQEATDYDVFGRGLLGQHWRHWNHHRCQCFIYNFAHFNNQIFLFWSMSVSQSCSSLSLKTDQALLQTSSLSASSPRSFRSIPSTLDRGWLLLCQRFSPEISNCHFARIVDAVHWNYLSINSPGVDEPCNPLDRSPDIFHRMEKLCWPLEEVSCFYYYSLAF